MPRVLNVAKLEKKFQALSRSRESIQGLSAWIMNHKEVYQDIVDQWLIGVSKKINTLAMFYVANEVIQGCGKKRCPEFREAFSKVLEKAASFENVKEIKKDVIRLLTLWKERNIYDDDLNQIIELKLNSSSVDKLLEEEEKEKEEEEELTEIEIIKQFKKEKLIGTLEIVKSFESEIKGKEEILNYADVPEMPDLDDIIVRKDCQDMMKKCDKYLALVRDCSDLASKEIRLRKKLLRDLKNSCIFYTAQQRDVKEVYNAFRIYGKRVKVMETRLSEKMSTLPFVDSPCFSEDNMSPLTSNYLSPYDTDASVASKNSLGMSPILQSEPSENSCSTSNLKQSSSFSGKITTESASELFQSIKQLSERKSVDESTTHEVEKSDLDKVFDSIKVDRFHKHPIFDKQVPLSQDSTNIENKEEQDILRNESNNCGVKLADISSKGTDIIESVKTYQEKGAKQIPVEKTSFSENNTKLSPDTKELHSSPCIRALSVQDRSESVLDKRTVSQSAASEQQEQPKSSSKQDAEDVDFLLDESYDSKKTKINVNYKRKIEFLLKSKGKKPCVDPSSEEVPEVVQVKLESPKCQTDTKPKSERKDDIARKEIDSRQVEIIQDDKRESISVKVEDGEEIDPKVTLNSPERNIHTPGSSMESFSDILKHSDNTFDANNTLADSGICGEDLTKMNTSPFNLSGTFTGSALSSLMSGMSTDFLRNILQVNQQKLQTKTQNDCDQKALPEVEFNSPGKKTLPNILDDLKTNDIPKEENSKNDHSAKLPNNDAISETETATTSVNIKSESSALLQEKQELTLLESDTARHSDIPDELKSISKMEVPDKVEEMLPSDPVQDTTSGVDNNDKLLNKNTNLLETLQNVLECLSENMLSGCDVKSLPPVSYPELEPPLSLESCMKIYKYIHGDDSTFKTENNISSIKINSQVKVVSAAPIIENNYGVMDMECDSEEEG